jgi:hypothetical protein
MLTVALTKAEYDEAVAIGLKRQALREERGKDKQYKDGGGTNERRNVVGAVAEFALASHLGPDVLDRWRKTQAFSLEHWKIKSDVGESLHVRSTEKSQGGLIAHSYDPNVGTFVLAIVNDKTPSDGASAVVTFPGWLPAVLCKTRSYWRDTGPGFEDRPAYCVRQRALRPMDTLPPEAIREQPGDRGRDR